MFKNQIEQINKDIRKTKRAIIALGCSFVQGSGALSEEIYNNYNWIPLAPGETKARWNLTKEDAVKLTEQFPEITVQNGQPDFLFHEYNNSFVNVLCKKYFNGDYAAINFGIAGSGNRATIKELHYYPDILWNEIEEHIVIYCPSGKERFDFIDDQYHDPNNHGRWKSMWPRELTEKSNRAPLWKGYADHLYSRKFETLEQISHIQELLLWCKYKKAKLIITPAFHRNYSINDFEKCLTDHVQRDHAPNEPPTINEESFSKHDIKNVINMWPWQNMFQPDGCSTFIDLVMKQEFPKTWKHNEHFYNYVGSGTPEKWITPCAHPASKGHDLFAQYLYKHITENN